MFSGIIIAATLLEMSANGIELKIDSERTVIDPGRSVILQVELKSPPGKTALLPDLRDRVEGFTLAEDFTDEPKKSAVVLMLFIEAVAAMSLLR